MAELNLNQITDRLNEEFAGEDRKLIFWYDAKAEFVDEVDTLELDKAKVLRLEPDNQFYIKYFLECVDTVTSYLVYAPFAKPAIRENHLADTIRYSKEFSVDRATLVARDLKIDERYKPVIQHYIKFFGSKARTQKFYDLEIESYSKSVIELALMSVLCKNKTVSFEDILRTILTEGGIQDNPILAELEAYDLIEPFWRQAEEVFGYQGSEPTLEKLLMTIFVTSLSKSLHCDVPQSWKGFVAYKSGNAIAFLDNMMNSLLYGEQFDALSNQVWHSLNGKAAFDGLSVDDIMDCIVIAETEERVLNWIRERLENEDVGAKLRGKTIPEICKAFRHHHFGEKRKSEYYILENAWNILSSGRYEPSGKLPDIAEYYAKTGYTVDRRYRHFYVHYDGLEDTSPYEKLRDLIENFYTNEYLNKLCAHWSGEFQTDHGQTGIRKQLNFYRDKIAHSKDKTVVIISDALRYEVGQSLFERLQGDEKCTASISYMESVMPSYTEFGMSALLPHKTIQMADEHKFLLDKKPSGNTEQRQAILQSYKTASRCVQYDDIKDMKIAELREIFTAQEVVYVYHNQIDARGDKKNTEKEVFAACEEAIEEIYKLIRRLTTSANTAHFFITADHGFIYKRDPLKESDKITATPPDGFMGKRYAVSGGASHVDGIVSVPLAYELGEEEKRLVSFPLGSDIFKVAGGGQNYIHGGCSPQEMLIPLIEVKTEKGSVATSTAQIELVSMVSKITNLITTLDFVQKEPVSDLVKETSYRIYFIGDNNERVSNEATYRADKKDADTLKRVFRVKFNFKNKQYDKKQKYYLVAYDANSDLEVMRHEIVMDIAFANDFGFDL